MTENDWLAERFEENRGRLRGVAYRMLGSLSEADDAIQEAWIRLSRSDPGSIENLAGWLTTVVARVCLDMLRSRTSRREESLDERVPASAAKPSEAIDPEQEALLADSVGLALLVVLDRLTPAERLAFVLHDMFALPFDEIASIVGRSATAVRQLASRARRRVQGAAAVPGADLSQQRKMIDAFLAALRGDDLEALIVLLDPEIMVRADEASVPSGALQDVHGAREWAKQALNFSRGAKFARPALVNGTVGVVVAPRGRLFRVLTFTIVGGKIAGIEVIGDPSRLRDLNVAVLNP